jgi:hypothetical protein
VLQVQVAQQPAQGVGANCCGVATAVNFKALLDLVEVASKPTRAGGPTLVRLTGDSLSIPAPLPDVGLGLHAARASALQLVLQLSEDTGTSCCPQWAEGMLSCYDRCVPSSNT